VFGQPNGHLGSPSVGPWNGYRGVMPNAREFAQIDEGPRDFQAAYKQPLRHAGEELLRGLMVPLIDSLVVRFVVYN
jgi:hypothetical protein